MAAKKPTNKKRDPRARPTAQARIKAAKEKKAKGLVTLPSTREIVNREKKVAFIEALAEYGTIKAACEASGVSRTTYYLWTDPEFAGKYGLDPAKHFDEEFRDLCTQALTGDWRDKVLQTGYDRAVNGWVRKKYDRNGVLMEEEHIYDSSILQMLMKRVDPELRDKPGAINVDARNQSVHLTESQSAKVIDGLTIEQKRLLLQMVELERAKEPEAIEGEVIKKE